MKRIRNAIAVLALAGALLVALATPANAHPSGTIGAHVCAGTGELLMNDPLYYPVNPGPLPTLNPPTNTTFGGTLGVCVNAYASTNPPSESADVSLNFVNGSVDGHCLRSTGSVSINGHASVRFDTVGSLVIIFGGNVTIFGGDVTVGVANAVPVVGTSCLTGAVRFQVTGAAVVTGS